MKIQCDVCNKDDASVFCTADEAALCDACDHRVHHANKLASKHHRFSLIHPSSKEFPVCDICQERRAFLFCQQDRAILCRECDLPIHNANEHTLKHNRFLLTGIKLSATSALYESPPPPTVATASSETAATDLKKHQPLTKESVSTASPPISNPNPPPVAAKNSTSTAAVNKGGGNLVGATSSISEYLIETLPGWHVEDFLDFSSAPFGFSKADNDMMLPFSDAYPESNLNSFSSENMGMWVPQAPQAPPHQYSHVGGGFVGFKETKEGTNMNASNRLWMDDGFTVPQISPPSLGSKRFRPF
ncbi:B-box zinc finger protein 21 [Pyrus communis]|uniref:B-box zinc finger protein 21 n=1 Tax=Pyrus communis TaxID=23211 RepID=UPI0035C23C62